MSEHNTEQIVIARQIAGSQSGGVPSPSGHFPAARRGRRPHIDLNEIDQKATLENAKKQAFNESRAAKIEKKIAEADARFVPAAKEEAAPVTKLEDPVTKLEEPATKTEADWPEESPKPTAKKAVKKAAKKAAKPKT